MSACTRKEIYGGPYTLCVHSSGVNSSVQWLLLALGMRPARLGDLGRVKVMTGLGAMCFSSGLDLAAQVLLLAWKMGAARMGYFSRREFMMGIRVLNAPSLDKLRKVLPKLDKDIDEDEDSFSSFFAFAFKFCLMVS